MVRYRGQLWSATYVPCRPPSPVLGVSCFTSALIFSSDGVQIITFFDVIPLDPVICTVLSRTCPDGNLFGIVSLYLHSPYMARQRRKHPDTCGEKHTETYVSGSSLPRPRKRSLGFPRPGNVFGATFYKGFYKAFGTRPFLRNLASPGQVSPDVSRLLIFLRNTM